MKKTYLLFFMLMLFVFSVSDVVAQHMVVNQVIVGSGGVYGDTTNSVSLAYYKPGNGVTTTFGSVDTQSIQDVVISGGFAYVAAQDSIAKFDLDSYERIAIIEATGVNRLLVNNDVVFASFQFPVTENFVKVYSAADLGLISNVSDVSDESAGLLVVGNLAYVAVPGGWASTVGKIAIIDIADYSLVDEVNFNSLGVGISDLTYYDSQIIAVCRTPWGGTNGYLHAMNALGTHTDAYLIEQVLGEMVGEEDGLLFTVMNGGVGIIDLEDFSIADSAFISAPELTISGVAMDTVDGNFYIATTDYFSTGVGTIYDALGIETGSFDAGVSPDAIAIDYRDNTGIDDSSPDNLVRIYPNPVTDILTIESINSNVHNYFKIIDISGRVQIQSHVNFMFNSAKINVSSLESGLYFLVLSNGSKSSASSFIKK